MKRLIYIGIMIWFAAGLQAQDIHYSQFYLSPLNLNPALTGVFNGDMRFAANYRYQWFTVPVPYTTVSGSFDSKILDGRIGDNVMGAGLQFNYDRAGDSKLSSMHIIASLAYAQKINKRNFFSIGGQIGLGQRSFKTDDLTFDSQFNGDIFDPTLNTEENFPSQSFIYNDANVGVNWRFQLTERTNFNIGGALHHLTTPKVSFFDSKDVRLARKWSGNIDASFQLGTVVDFMPAFLYQRQGTYQEMVAGASFKYHLSVDRGKEVGLMIGSWYRPGDAVIPSVGLQYNNLRVGFSYDINISPLKIATNRNGGPELGLIYIIRKVKSINPFKSCPIF